MTADQHSEYRSPKRALLERGLRPRKRFGQNFLVDAKFAARVAVALPENSFMVEIGGGTGALTEALAARARSLIVLEIDRDLAGLLRERFVHESSRVDVRECDALKFDYLAALSGEPSPRAICGNLPYYITTPLLERIVESADAWDCAVLMVQHEYAKRLCAAPGTPEYGSLTAFIGHYCRVEKLFDVGAAGFYPAPSVASAVVRLTPLPGRQDGLRDELLLLRVIRAAFSQRRKTLANCIVSRAATGTPRLAIEVAIRGAGIDPVVRGERLGADDFRRLANALSDAGIAIC